MQRSLVRQLRLLSGVVNSKTVTLAFVWKTAKLGDRATGLFFCSLTEIFLSRSFSFSLGAISRLIELFLSEQ